MAHAMEIGTSGMSAVSAASHSESKAVRQAYQILHLGFTVAPVVAAWLMGIVRSLLMSGQYSDVALRGRGATRLRLALAALALAALALARLS
jgi:hypothetical protein